MRFIADLHIHSHYSRATSSQLVPEQLWRWGQLKGLNIIATGDITHPQWLEELGQALQPAPHAPGLFELNSELRSSVQFSIPETCRHETLFILSGEISSIYKKDDKVRKIHNVVFMPSIAAAAKFQNALERIGNIHSDGRPILGLDARDLLEIVLETDPNAHLIPAHIWTPWFSLLGSQSGFDSITACFGDLTKHIFAVETGLSSDPPMNWRLSMLDGLNLVSNSDAHSPEKLAREANLFNTELSYPALFAALQEKQPGGFAGTIEFFPEEGKYHMDGHRKCNKMMRPHESQSRNGLCPVCGKPATLGVSYRVQELADRPEGFHPSQAKPFHSLVPLPELLGEVFDVGPASKKVQAFYHCLLQAIGPELMILMDHPLPDIERTAGPMVAEAIRRMRSGEIDAQPGFDGEYGFIRLFKPEERSYWLQQSSLFAPAVPTPLPKKTASGENKQKLIKNSSRPAQNETTASAGNRAAEEPAAPWGLNPEQLEAVRHRGSPLIIQAGPGTGKTRTLISRIAELLKEGFAEPETMLAITFTNKAAAEMRERLTTLLGAETAARLPIQTFHAFGRGLLAAAGSFFGRSKGFTILDTENDPEFRRQFQERSSERLTAVTLQRVSALKSMLYAPQTLPQEILSGLPPSFPDLFRTYEALLVEKNAVDYDDLIALPVRLLRFDPEMRRQMRRQVQVIAVDEFQDINAAQYELFHIFAFDARDICVIGDPDQAIYGFRGASREFFARMQQSFPNARLLRLERNYRSTANILTASTEMLRDGKPASPELSLIPHIHSDVKIQFHAAASDLAEAIFVVQQIELLMGGTSHFSMDSGRGGTERGQPYTFSDFAVLLRTRMLADPLEEAFIRSSLPFKRIADQYQKDREVLSDDRCEVADLDPRGDRVQILTLHAAKGLEFPVVFIVGCEENILPFSFGSASDVEEERRLLYVGMTRAQERLYLSHARSRMLRGQRHAQTPSRFLAAISKQLLQKHTTFRKSVKNDSQLNLF